MAGVRVLVGRQGAFVLTSDERRKDWHPDRIWASQSGGWFGQVVQRSDDGGRTFAPVGNDFTYDGVPGTHRWYDGTPHPWKFARMWHLEPSLTDPDTVYAGVEHAALFRTTDGGLTWAELAGLRGHGSGPQWQPGAGAARCATRRAAAAVRSSASSPAARTCRTPRRTTRCPRRSCASGSRCSWWARWPGAERG